LKLTQREVLPFVSPRHPDGTAGWFGKAVSSDGGGRRPLGEEAVEAMRAEALDLLARIRRHQQGGTPVDDPRVREPTARVDTIGTAFHGGDRPLIAAANEMWMGNRVEISRRLGRPADGPDIVDYLHRARQVRRDSPTDGARPRGGG
jgi:hypothetical protein